MKSPVDVYRLHNLPALTASEKEAKKKEKKPTKAKKSQKKTKKNGKTPSSEEATATIDEKETTTTTILSEVDAESGTMAEDAVAQLRGRKSWGDKSVANMLASIESRRTLPMHK